MAYNITKLGTTSTVKKILFFVVIIVCLIIVNNLAHSIYNLWHKQDLVVKANRDLENEKQENKRLKQQLIKVKSKDFIETEARNKLLMVKPGESGVILPSNIGSSKSALPSPELPNWQKWLNLFGF